MYLLAGVAEAACEHELNLRVHILHIGLDGEIALLDYGVDVPQFGCKDVEFFLGEQLYRL